MIFIPGVNMLSTSRYIHTVQPVKSHTIATRPYLLEAHTLGSVPGVSASRVSIALTYSPRHTLSVIVSTLVPGSPRAGGYLFLMDIGYIPGYWSRVSRVGQVGYPYPRLPKIPYFAHPYRPHTGPPLPPATRTLTLGAAGLLLREKHCQGPSGHSCPFWIFLRLILMSQVTRPVRPL